VLDQNVFVNIVDRYKHPPARAYAAIRQDRTIKPSDVVQLACASAAAVDLFITNDERLSTKIIPGIEFVTSLERATL
jgi:hypothetical protein